MTWGAVNEWTTQAAYARLAKLADHPTLTELLRRIMKQEGRHIDFYATQARSPAVPTAGRPKAHPVGPPALLGPGGQRRGPRPGGRFLRTYLFGDDDGLAMADRIDRRVDRLPGLEGCNLLRGAVVPAA